MEPVTETVRPTDIMHAGVETGNENGQKGFKSNGAESSMLQVEHLH